MISINGFVWWLDGASESSETTVKGTNFRGRSWCKVNVGREAAGGDLESNI